MHDEHAIHTIDTGFHRPHFDAAYLIVENGRAAFIDCGTNHSRPRMMQALTDAGLTVNDVDWLILTHVHLDHAGGAGELMASLPNARLVVHPRGARHMIDPSKLWAGATAVYGEEEMRRSYGALKPIPAERVVEAPDGHEVNLPGRILRCLDTPGHARHHNAIHDTRSGHVFSGDTFGLSYRELDSDKGPFIIPTTSPVQFDPDALHASIRRLVALDPPAIHLTHFGPVQDVKRLATDLHCTIDAMVDIAHRHADDEQRHAALVQSLERLYIESARQHGSALSAAEVRELLAVDTELNAQGLEVWLDRRTN
ncbi:MAG TPA: MBL fold metallo-hydrolase [Rhodanobacteraceae bacterium]|nr:MBL fold metallo-hydrolase [Rhodanobacteraceae bacterium]